MDTNDVNLDLRNIGRIERPLGIADEGFGIRGLITKSKFRMLDSSPKQTAGELVAPEEAQDLLRRRRKRYRAQRQKRLERLQKKALIALLFLLTIGLVLAAWYGLLKN